MDKKKKKKKSGYSFRLLAFDMARAVMFIMCPFFRVKIIRADGSKHKERFKGGAIIAANHSSFSDPLIVAMAFIYRRVHFLAAEIVMKGKLRSTLLSGLGAIKIQRDIADIEAIKKSVEVLKLGRLLIVFPQGGIDRENDSIESLKSGAVLMALQAGVPIIPVHINHRKHWYKKNILTIGETVYPDKICKKKMPTTADINEATKVLMDEMNRVGSENDTYKEKNYEHI